MHKLVPLLFLVIAMPVLHSQQLSPVVTSPGGSFFSNQYGMLSSTIGELAAVETYENQYLILTQGFQQPLEMMTGITDYPQDEFEFEIYPNPTNGNFKIVTKSDTQTNIDIQIHDLVGHEIYHGQMVHDAEISIYQVNIIPPQGVYFITLHCSSANSTKPGLRYFQKINIIH